MKKLRIPNFLWPPAKWSNRYPPHIGTIATSPLYVNLVCHNSADNHLSQNIALMCSYVWSGVTHTTLYVLTMLKLFTLCCSLCWGDRESMPEVMTGQQCSSCSLGQERATPPPNLRSKLWFHIPSADLTLRSLDGSWCNTPDGGWSSKQL